MAGQLGMFSRINFNAKILNIGKIDEKNINPSEGFHNYGNIKTNYIILSGSVIGAKKRQLLLTFPLRKTKKQVNKDYEFVNLIR